MDPRFVTKQIHAYLDYPVAISLLALPPLLGLGSSHPAALWIAITAGAAALLMTIFTDHQFGLLRVLPYGFHLTVDFIVGAAFLLMPSILGFSGIDAWYYWINGAAVVLVIALHKPESASSEAIAAA